MPERPMPTTVQCPHCGRDIGSSDYEKTQHMYNSHRDIMRKRLKERGVKGRY